MTNVAINDLMRYCDNVVSTCCFMHNSA